MLEDIIRGFKDNQNRTSSIKNNSSVGYIIGEAVYSYFEPLIVLYRWLSVRDRLKRDAN